MHIFVYGTLKKGHSNHHFIETASYIGEDRTRENYLMIDPGHFPAILEKEGFSAINGETYIVDKEILQILDKLEGKWFYRKEVPLESGKSAYVYFLSPEFQKRDYPLIKDGNWTNRNEKQQE